jgi:hypothetical protein
MKMLCAEHELSDYEKGEQTAGRLACLPAVWARAAGLLSGWRLIEPDEQLMSS